MLAGLMAVMMVAGNAWAVNGPTTRVQGTFGTYTFSISGAAHYHWTLRDPSGNTSETLGSTSKEYGFSYSGSYNVSVIAHNSSNNVVSGGRSALGVTVSRYPSPITTLSGEGTSNTGETKVYTVTHNVASGPKISWTLNTVAIAGETGTSVSIPFNDVGTQTVGVSVYPLNYVDSVTVKTLSVVVTPSPPVVTMTGSATATEGETKTYEISHNATLPATISWTLDGAVIGGATGASIDIPFTTAGSRTVLATVTYTGYPAVSSSASQAVSVTPVAPTISISGATTAYAGETKQFSMNHNTALPITITWDVGGTPYSGNPIDVPFAVPGDFTVSGTVAYVGYPGVSATATQAVAVTPGTPTISVTGPATVIVGETKQYSASHNSTLPATITWDVGGTTYSGSPVDIPFAAVGNFTVAATVTLTGYPSVSATSSQAVAVTPPIPAVTLSGPTTAIAGDTKQFSVTHDATFSSTISWNVDGTTYSGSAIDVPFPTAGSYDVAVTVALVDYPSVTVTRTMSIVVSAYPTPTISISGPATASIGDTKQYSVTHDAVLPVTVGWNINGTTYTGLSADIPFTAAGNYTIVATVTYDDYPNVFATSTKTVLVSPVAPTVSISGPATAATGALNQYLVVHDATVPVNVSWNIDGDESTGDHVNVAFASVGSKTVTVTVTPLDFPEVIVTSTKTVLVSPAIPTVSIAGPATAIEGTTKRYNVSHNSAFPVTVEWEVAGDATSEGIDIAFSEIGNQEISATVFLTDYPEITQTITKTVIVSRYPAPSISLTGPTVAIEGETKHYSISHDESLPTTIEWDLDGTKFTGGEIDITYPLAGSFNLTVAVFPTAYPGSVKTGSISVAVLTHAAPVLSVSGPSAAIEGETKHYSVTHNESLPVTIEWTVNGATFTGSQVDIPFALAGKYDVTVSVFPVAYPEAIATSVVAVTVEEIARPIIAITGNRKSMEGRTEEYTSTVSNTTDPVTIEWDVEGVKSQGASVSVPFATAGLYNITATVYPTGRPDRSTANIITIVVATYPKPSLSVDGAKTTTEGKTEKYTATVSGSEQEMAVDWTVNGVSYQGPVVDVTYPTPGTYTVTATAYPTGVPTAQKSLSFIVTVVAVKAPVVSVASIKKGFVGVPLSLSATVTGQQAGETLVSKWTLPDGTTIDGLTATYSPRSQDIGTAGFRFASHPEGYPDSKKVVDLAVPVATYVLPTFTLKKYHQPSGVAPFAVVYSASANLSSLNGEQFTYAWDMGNGAIVPARSTISYAYSQPGTYAIALTVTDGKGNTQVLPDSVTVTGVSPITISAIAVRGTNAYMKPPVVGIFKPTITGGNQKVDRFVTYAWTIDGQKVGNNTNRLSYRFETAGTYTVGLTVRSKSGLSGTGAVSVTINPNQAPDCSIEYLDNPALKSTKIMPVCVDADGRMRSFSWDLGNGQTLNVKNVTARYTASGIYTVTLTATDNSGGETTVSRDIEVKR